jgi:hypothetical protein
MSSFLDVFLQGRGPDFGAINVTGGIHGHSLAASVPVVAVDGSGMKN